MNVVLNGVVINVVNLPIDPAAFPEGCEFIEGLASPGDLWDGVTFSPAPNPDQRITKLAFQKRFPASGVGVANKFDLLMLFLQDDGYASGLVPDATERLTLRANIAAGKNRLDAATHISLWLPDAGNFTALLLDLKIPAAFRLTSAERNAILSTNIADDERPT